MVRRVGGNPHERCDAGFERSHADRRAGLERDGGMLQVHVERIEPGGGGDARDLRRAHEPHRHRGHHLVALKLFLDIVAQDVGDPHRPVLPLLFPLAVPCSRYLGLIDALALCCRREASPGGEQARKLSMNYTTDFKSIRGQVSAEEWQARVDLAACYRLVDKYGMTDLIYNHITARIPGSADHLLINLYGMLYKEITASSLVKIDVEGEIVWKPDTDYGINKSGYVIHGAIHKPGVACVLHTHTRAGIAVSAMKCGLLPLSQTSIRFVGHVGYHDYEGPAVDLDERERIVADLGPHDALIMRNHGLLTCGATVQQAFNTMYHLELSCRSQVDAMAARAELVMPGENVLAHTAHLYQPGTRRPYGVLEWPAMLRLLEAEDRNSGYPPYWH